jgi:hypothetical protein
LLAQGLSRGFAERHTQFGYVFYNDMKKKPVAQAEHQHYLLEKPPVHGVLSHLCAAIVVNCFTPVAFRAAGTLAVFARPGSVRFRSLAARLTAWRIKFTGYALSRKVEVRYV